jgi:hypothetical protein
MAFLAPPTQHVVLVTPDERLYGTGTQSSGFPDLHGPDLQLIRRSMKEIFIRQEQRASQFVQPASVGEISTVNPVPSRRRRTVQVLFNHRGRGLPARFAPDPE